VQFNIGGQKQSVQAVVMKAVHEVILGIDFLIDADVDWIFSQGKIKLGDEWIQLHKRQKMDDVLMEYVCDECEILPGCQAGVPVEILRPTLNLGSDYWADDPIELEDGVVVARTLFTGETHNAIVRVINLTDDTYYVRKEQYFGTASRVKICDAENQCTNVGQGFQANSVRQTTPSKGTEKNGIEHIECFLEGLPSELSPGHEQIRAFLTRNSKVFSESEFDIGRTHLVEHKIETDDSRPVRQALRRHPVAYLPLIDDYVQEMQDSGIIEPRIGSE